MVIRPSWRRINFLTCRASGLAAKREKGFVLGKCGIKVSSVWSDAVRKRSHIGREPWSCGYGRRLIFWRSWVQIQAPYTEWTFFTLICCKIVLMFAWKTPKMNKKEAGGGPFKNMPLFPKFHKISHSSLKYLKIGFQNSPKTSPNTWATFVSLVLFIFVLFKMQWQL